MAPVLQVITLPMKFGGFIVFYYVFKNSLFVEDNGSLHFNYSCYSPPPATKAGVHTRRAERGWGVKILEDARHRIGLLQ
jgi:hypothetical protein